MQENTTIVASEFIPGQPGLIIHEQEYGKTLVIADLHIGFVYAQNKQGIIIPFERRPEKELFALVKEKKPNKVIVAGDFKDDIFGANKALAQRVWEFLQEMLAKTEIGIIKGNHDGKIESLVPPEVEIVQASGVRLKDTNNQTIGIWHGHATPAVDVITADLTISAHIHPAYSFRDNVGSIISEKVWVKAKWREKRKEQRNHIIMPAFNNFIDGLSVDHKNFGNALSTINGVDFLEGEVYTLDGVLLGTITELQAERKSLESERTKALKDLSSISHKKRKKKKGRS